MKSKSKRVQDKPRFSTWCNAQTSLYCWKCAKSTVAMSIEDAHKFIEEHNISCYGGKNGRKGKD